MTLEQLNTHEVLEENIIHMVKGFFNKTEKYPDATTQEKKIAEVDKVMIKLIKRIKKIAPKLREWEELEMGDKISSGTANKAIHYANDKVGIMRVILEKTPEKALKFDIDRVANAMVNAAVRSVTGSKKWDKPDWFGAIAAKLT